MNNYSDVAVKLQPQLLAVNEGDTMKSFVVIDKLSYPLVEKTYLDSQVGVPGMNLLYDKVTGEKPLLPEIEEVHAYYEVLVDVVEVHLPHNSKAGQLLEELYGFSWNASKEVWWNVDNDDTRFTAEMLCRKYHNTMDTMLEPVA